MTSPAAIAAALQDIQSRISTNDVTGAISAIRLLEVDHLTPITKPIPRMGKGFESSSPEYPLGAEVALAASDVIDLVGDASRALRTKNQGLFHATSLIGAARERWRRVGFVTGD